jgi:hypothetical protein
MGPCDKDGSTCYWFSAKRKMNDCSVCGWDCPEKCHSGKMLCAACFEEDMDAMHGENDKWYYPACMAPSCRTKTIKQRAERDQAMNKESSAPVVKQKILPPPPSLSPPPPLPWNMLSASSSSAAAASSPYVPAPATAAATSSVDMRELQETVTNLQNEVRAVSQKMELMMEILETLRLAVCLSQPEPTTFQ